MSAPSLKKIQQKLNKVLIQIYSQKPSVHGFSKDRSILTNASKHLDKRHIFNLDLEKFFDTIHFGRVKNMFMGKPYNLPHAPATVLAQICCFNNKLPQGAPTSPIVTNMLCAQLDSQLQKLAQKHNCSYTRYADDLTFSFTCSRNRLPPPIVEFGIGHVTPGSELTEIIRNNGFSINYGKVRLCTGSNRFEVTGLTVNEFPNVKRTYVRQIQSMLYAWQKFGLEKAGIDYIDNYRSKQWASHAKPNLKNVIRGKLRFLKMVKGHRDVVYVKFAKWFNSLISETDPQLEYAEPTDSEKNAFNSLWILESLYDDANGKCQASQGTGFMLKGFGLITCAHVVATGKVILSDIFAFKCEMPHEENKYKVEVVHIDYGRDLAILKFKDIDAHEVSKLPALEPELIIKPKLKDNVKLLGFPAYKLGQSVFIADAKVATIYPQAGVEKFEIDAQIREGNSGGPILNEVHRVIGIAAEGAEKSGGNNAVVGISELLKLIP